MIESTRHIKSIFKQFDDSSISYCVARNYAFLFENRVYEGKDIDVVVLSKDVKKISSIMSSNHFGEVPVNPFSKKKLYAHYVHSDENLVQFHFHFDGITGRHTRYLQADSLLKRRIKKNFLYVASNEDEFLAVLLHTVLDLDFVKEKYKDALSKLFNSRLNLTYVEEKLSIHFTHEQITSLFHFISTKKYAALEHMMPSLKRRFFVHNIFKIAVVFLGGSIWKSKQVLKPAPLVSLIGMDGAGKTTTTKVLERLLAKNRIPYSIIYTGRGRDNILPIQFFGKVYRSLFNIKNAEKSVPSQVKKNSKPVSVSFLKKTIYTLAAPVFAFDLLLRYWFRIFPKRLLKKVVITDRYSSDILLMVHVPEVIKKFLYVFFPKPTTTIYLWNKAEVLHKRKSDHPFDDLKRQELLFHDINKKIRPIAIKSDSISDTTKEVAEIVFEKLFI